MASKYYTEPADIMPGIQMLGQGLEKRAGFERERVKTAKTEKLRKQVGVMLNRSPEEVAKFVVENPEAAPLFKEALGAQSDAMLNISKQYLIEGQDPFNLHVAEADKDILEGRDPAGNIEMSRAMLGEETRAEATKQHEMVLAMYGGKDWDNYQKLKGKGKKDKFVKGTPYINEAGDRVVPIYNEGTKELVRTETLGKPQVKAGPVDPAKIKAIGDAIISGKQPPKIGRELGKMAGPLRAYLANQGFDQSTAMLDFKATGKYLTSLNSRATQQLVMAVDFAAESLDIVDELATEWGSLGLPVLSKANLEAAKRGTYGDKAASIATRLTGQIIEMQSELAVVYKGGGSPTDKGLEQASHLLKGEWAEKVLKDNTELIRKNLKLRKNTFKALRVQGASDTNPYSKSGEQGRHGAKPKYKEGQTATINGKPLIFKNGQWEDI